jgi:hypothetical protein
MLRDTAIAWMNARLPHQAIRRDFERHFDAAAAAGRNFYMVIGRHLTVDGKAHLLHFFAGELFIFELTEDQARGFPLKAGQVLWGTGGLKDRTMPAEEPVAVLSNLAIGLRLGRPIMAEFSYSLIAQRAGQCALRLDYDIPGAGSVTSWNYPNGLIGPKGRIRCWFAPMELAFSGKTIFAPVAMFVRLCALSDRKTIIGREPISNTVGALVTIARGRL